MRARPKPEDFTRFANLERHVHLIREATQVLKVVIQSDSAQLQSCKEQIHYLRNKGNEIVRAEIKRLDHKLEAPFFQNREDHYRIFAGLDDVLESLCGTTSRLLAYRIDRPPSDWLEMAGIAGTCGETLLAMLEAANTDGRLGRDIGEIHRLREQAAQITLEGLTELFTNEQDPCQLLKFKEGYERLEGSIAEFTKVARAVEDMVVKHRDSVSDFRVS